MGKERGVKGRLSQTSEGCGDRAQESLSTAGGGGGAEQRNCLLSAARPGQGPPQPSGQGPCREALPPARGTRL